MPVVFTSSLPMCSASMNWLAITDQSAPSTSRYTSIYTVIHSYQAPIAISTLVTLLASAYPICQSASRTRPFPKCNHTICVTIKVSHKCIISQCGVYKINFIVLLFHLDFQFSSLECHKYFTVCLLLSEF